MKNKILTLLLTIIAMMWAGNVQAQQSFEIDGGEIDFTTSANLTGPWLQSGKVSWDAMTKTLTLDNAILVAKKNAFNFIDIRHIGWTLRLIGSNSITTSGWTGITTVDADLKIKGGGSLKIDAQVYAISHTGADKGVTIENCTVETSKSFSGTKGNGSSLAIKNATVKFSKVMNFKSISLVGCKIKVPVNGRVDTNDYGMQIIVDKDGEEAKSVEIEAGPAINYDLSICGTKVTSANCDNLSALDGVEGTVSYDDDTKTLNLVVDNATLKVKGATGGWGWKDAGISYLKSYQLKNCHISTAGVKFGKQSNFTYYELLGTDGNTYYGEVEIVPGKAPTDISAVTADASQGKHGIYTLDGIRLNGTLNDLPAGIYIVNGRKVVK